MKMSWMARCGAVVCLAALAAGCTSYTTHRGFIAEDVLMDSVQPGIDNRESVQKTLGRPTFESQYGEPVWYYVATIMRQAPFASPRIDQETVLAVKFDDGGNVSSVQRSGLDKVVRLHPNGDKTPTLGRERGFLEDLFGNIGRVGAGGTGDAAGGSSGGS
jgi:outer membrane protein assembly factor BamE (lipoprotein component of BamABCDE complex)